MKFEEVFYIWKKEINENLRKELIEKGSLSPTLVVLVKDGDDFHSLPLRINGRTEKTVRNFMYLNTREGNVVAYIAFSEALINITKPEDYEKTQKLYESVNYDMSKVKTSINALIVVEETLFSSDVKVFDVVKDDAGVVISPDFLKNMRGAGDFDLLTGYLMLKTPTTDGNNIH